MAVGIRMGAIGFPADRVIGAKRGLRLGHGLRHFLMDVGEREMRFGGKLAVDFAKARQRIVVNDGRELASDE